MNATTYSTDTTDLIERVKDLPPELYNEIYKWTFTVATKQDVHIDRAWKPPSCQQVNRETRDQYAHDYYSQTIFYVNAELVGSWCISLNGAIDLVKCVRIKEPGIDAEKLTLYLLWSRLYHASWRVQTGGWLGSRVRMAVECIEFKVTFGSEEKMMWLSFSEIRPHAHNAPSELATVWYDQMQNNV